MEDTSDSCFGVVTVEGSGTEQPSASSERRAVGEAQNADPAEKPLLSEATGTAQPEEGSEQQSSLEQSALKEQEQSSLAQWQLPSEGVGNQEVIGNNEQDVFEPDAPFSASPESTSPVTNENYSTSLELRNSEREEQTSQNSVLSENMASGTVTGKEVTKMLHIKALKRGGFFLQLDYGFLHPPHPHSVHVCWFLVLKWLFKFSFKTCLKS